VIVISTVLLLAGGFFLIVSAVGLERLPEVYTRAHAVAKSETLALMLVFAGLFFRPELDAGGAVRLALVVVFSVIANPTAVRAMLQTVVARLRQTESTIQQVEKMAALGTMAAGILHELNNPAAAVQRGAALLGEQLPSLWEVEDELGAAGVAPPAPLEDKSPPGDAIERADREDELAAWLEDLGVADPWDVANVLVGDGWDVDRLAASGVDAGSPHAARLVRALALRTQAVSLLEEIRVAAARLSDLVGAVKRYAHVGEAPVGSVDIEASLRDTLIVMRHQLGGIEVVEDYAPDLPPVEAHGTELSQIWTNVIDNAADAMDGEGTLTLRASADGRWVVVEIADTGPGMPPDVRDRIFEPFFTTKEPGQGTGLGLHTVYQLVTRNRGSIDLDTSPDGTTFRVHLPAADGDKS
jgi:monovalent cation/proton antiporter MnhG/PhaG subunit